MNAPVLATPVAQPEMFWLDETSAPSIKLGTLELANGRWQALPPGFHVDAPQFDSRDTALNAAIDAMIDRAHRFTEAKEGTSWTPPFAQRVIEWALKVKANCRAETGDEEINPAANSANVLDVKAASEEITDPVIRDLVAANRARKVYPDGHTFRMTNPMINGQWVTLGSCECGTILSYPYTIEGRTALMPAAIEAHWQSFDHLPATVDGRGQPIVETPTSAKPKRKPKSQPGAGGLTPAPIGPAPLAALPTVEGAGPSLGDDADRHRFWVLMAIDAGKTVDGDDVRDLVGVGYAHCTATRVMVTDEGREFLAAFERENFPDVAAQFAAIQAERNPSAMMKHNPDALSGSGQVGTSGASDVQPADLLAPADPAAVEGASVDARSHAPPAIYSEADRSDWEALSALAGGKPIDEVALADLVRRGLAHELRPGDWMPTKAGFERGQALHLHFWEPPTLEQIRARFYPDEEPEASPIGEASPEKGGGFPVAAAPSNAEETGALGLSVNMASDAPAPVPTDQQAVENVPGPALATKNVITSPDDADDLLLDWPSYETYLSDKVVVAPIRGIEVLRESLHPWLKPHCKDLVVWALRLGCAAIFASFGLHKTAMQLEWCRQLQRRQALDGKAAATLNVVPLGVRHGFIGEAVKLDMDVRFIRTDEEYHALFAEGVRHFLTNYESIREGKLDPNLFGAVSLDEASVLRSYGSKTYQEFLPLFAKVPFKLVATATPSPNRYKELIHYAGFLGVMDTGLALTRWFQRNSEKAGDLTLYPHKEDEFWMWVHSWAAFLQKPSELGHSDDGYELPPLSLRWHEVPADHSKAEPERDGQGVMFRAVANSLQEAAASRRDSLKPRVAKMLEIIAHDPAAHRIIWHDLEAEREAIEAALPGVVTIMGSMDIDAREARLHDFEEGRIKYFGTKPILSGSGSNFQYHCHKAIYVGLPGNGYKFNDFIQSLYRLQRFGQAFPVEVDIIYSEDERAGRDALIEKWALDTEMRKRMSEIIKRHGLDTLPMRDAMLRSIGVKRVEVKGERFVAINNDTVAECRSWTENSVDLLVTSVPFANQYEYTPSYNDFGHTDDTAHFWGQMDFLTPEWLRILKPGRLACVHVKDRVLFGSVTGEGVPTISPFHAEAIMHYRAHGFQFMGMITVVTDVVRENNQTYRLGWSENAKDGTKMGVGCPEYILLLRKPQSDRSRGYADMPVEKSKEDYTRARWQIDAHGFWRSSGNRHLTPEEFAQCSSADLAKLFSKATVDAVYDHEAHVKIGELHERLGTLPATFMAIAPGSHHPDVWHDVNRMRTLNSQQNQKGREMHLCLARGSRVLTRRAGYIPIEAVAIGDEVLTHRGRWRPVTVKANTGVRPVVTVKAQGVPGLTLTPDHKLWTRRVAGGKWAEQHSRRSAAETDPWWLEAIDTEGSYVNLKLPPTEEPKVSNLLLWAVAGRWLADGHYSTAGSFVLSCGKHELEHLLEVLGPYAGKHRDTGTAIQIILKDPTKELFPLLRTCGRGAAGKHLPACAFTLPLLQADALLSGYLSGDGHFLEERQRWMASSISRDLVLGIAMLVQRVNGAIAAIYSGRKPGTAIIQGRKVTTRQEWILSYDIPHPERRKGLPFIMHDGAWKKVRTVEPAGEAETWCLRVEEDESFTAEGCIVKNCPLQFDIVDRLIERYSNPGELVLDPFGGLMTVPYRALLKGRRGAGIELNAGYFLDGVHYCRMAEEKATTPQLFDLATFDKANTPPSDLVEAET